MQSEDGQFIPVKRTPRETTFPKLIVLDLDGTTLGGGHLPYARIPDRVAAFLDGLTDAGCAWAINTTWDVNGQWDLVMGSPVCSRPEFLVAELGRRVARVGSGGPEFIEPYTTDTDTETRLTARKYMVPLIFDLLQRYTPASVNYYGHLLSFATSDDPAQFDRDATSRYSRMEGMSVSVGNGQLKAVLSMLSKGRGLAEVLRVGGYAPEDVMVAGDEFSDVSMMQPACAAYAICPSNADPSVKRHVERIGGVIASRPNGDGVIEGFALLAKRYNWKAPERAGIF